MPLMGMYQYRKDPHTGGGGYSLYATDGETSIGKIPILGKGGYSLYATDGDVPAQKRCPVQAIPREGEEK